MTPILIIPGYQNSGPDHWQSLWEDMLPDARRVEMPSWDRPVLHEWIGALEEAIEACEAPPILVAHSLGCVAVVRWSATHGRAVHGALLVTPADVERPDSLPELRPFAPIPRHSLPFPTVVAGSRNDPFMSLARARSFAADWAAQFVDLGCCGHMNSASGHGPWPRGEELLAELR